MTFSLKDDGTGEIIFADMMADIGKYVEVWQGDQPSAPMARISSGSYQVPGEPVPPDPGPDPGPDPIPPTPGDDGMDKIDNEDQLRDALQTYANEMRVGSCYSKTPIRMTKPIMIAQYATDGMPWGANLNFTRLQWQGPGGQDMITYRGIDGIANRCLYFEKACFDGNGYAAAPAGSCFKLWAPDGDPGSIYKFTVRDIFTGYATHGIHIAGAVFEGMMENVHAENHTSHGIFMEHLGLDGMSPWSIVSNIMIIHGNSSRNFGAGMRQVYSVNSIMGSYVLNALGGIQAPDGLRAVMMSNGENTGEVLFDMASNGYGSVVVACEASGDAKTVARKYENGQWVDVGKPMLYGITDVGAYDQASHTAYYGNPPDPMRWKK